MATKNVQKSITLNKFGAESDFGIASTIPYSITASNMMACVPTNQTSIELKPRNDKGYFVSRIVLTYCGKNVLFKQNAFLTCSWRLLRSYIRNVGI